MRELAPLNMKEQDCTRNPKGILKIKVEFEITKELTDSIKRPFSQQQEPIYCYKKNRVLEAENDMEKRSNLSKMK